MVLIGLWLYLLPAGRIRARVAGCIVAGCILFYKSIQRGAHDSSRGNARGSAYGADCIRVFSCYFNCQACVMRCIIFILRAALCIGTGHNCVVSFPYNIVIARRGTGIRARCAKCCNCCIICSKNIRYFIIDLYILRIEI